jgi:hypothetical protein
VVRLTGDVEALAAQLAEVLGPDERRRLVAELVRLDEEER